jgi:fermentation-respiration switch protein FrsA (DUF1100 family)
MKFFPILFLSLFGSILVTAQDITGQWNGVLKVQGTQLRLVFNITKTGSIISSTMDSPDQGAKGIPTTSTSFENSVLKITNAAARIEYEGTLGSDDVITGTFKQNGQSFPLNLSKASIQKEASGKPQEPKKPYPYYSEDVTFQNKKAGITLAGTLTLPKKEGLFPVIVLISGSGPQNRDGELLGHKPFLVAADYLTKNGIGVLRFDDRGTALSKGDFASANSADFATDVESAVEYLKTRTEINKAKIGLLGHSEGGIIAPMVASKSNDVAFLVLLAVSGVRGDQLLLLQQRAIGKASGISDDELKKIESSNKKGFEIVQKSTSIEQLKTNLTAFIRKEMKDNPGFKKPEGMTEDELVKLQVSQTANPWMYYFIKYDPAPALEKVTCPVLALNGLKDLQVPAKENLAAIQQALVKGGNKKVTTKELPNLNHLFQECTTGLPNEYATLEQTFSPTALEEIAKWVGIQTK